MKIVLGKSEDTITMILDNLSSNHNFGNISILNNLKIDSKEEIYHPDFTIEIVEEMILTDISGFILGIYNPNPKKKIIESFGFKPNRFVNVVHKSAQISKTTSLGYGCLINSNVSIAGKSIIKDFVSINRNSSIGHHTIIEKFCSINPGSNIAGHCHIGEGTLIGMGSQVLNGISVGKNSIIGAGSVVTKDIPDNVVAWGSPCKIQRYA